MSELIRQAYQQLNLTTPLLGDCGSLCEQRCCQGDDAGMWLLPGEKELLGSEAGYRFIDAYDGTILICSNRCRRDFRPFACRIFPLFPFVQEKADGAYSIRLDYDPRGAAICPLAASRYPLRGIFRYLVRRSTRLLLQDPQIADWFVEHSAYLQALRDIDHYRDERHS